MDRIMPSVMDSATGLAEPSVALVDLLDRVLARGAVIVGDVTLSIADIDLVHVSLQVLIASVHAEVPVDDSRPAPR